jgi:ParB family chromosome partitioning protein
MTDRRSYAAGITRSRESTRRGNLADVLQISEDGVGQLSEAKIIALVRIEPNPDQPRRAFDDATLRELADSIEARGVLQPIRVRRRGERFQIIAGERRFRAAQMAGLTEMPAVVVDQDDDNSYIDALIENIQREDLNPLDRAEALRRLRVKLQLSSWEAVGLLIGMGRQSVHNLLGLSELPPEMQDDIRSGELTEKHGRALRKLKHTPALQQDAYQRIFTNDLSGDDSLALVRELKQSARPGSDSAPSPILIAAREIARRADDLGLELNVSISVDDRRAAVLALRRAMFQLEAALSRLGE